MAFLPNDPPVVTVQPTSQSILQFGSTVSLAVKVKRTGPFIYQWPLEKKDIPGATAATYTIDNYLPEHMGSYEVVIRNAVGYTRSKTAVLDASLPTIGEPESEKVIDGANVTMTVAPTAVETVIGIHTNVVLRVEPQGTGPFAYQWSFNGEAIDGATRSALAVETATEAEAGQYTVRLTNRFGAVTSLAANVDGMTVEVVA